MAPNLGAACISRPEVAVGLVKWDPVNTRGAWGIAALALVIALALWHGVTHP